MSNIKKWIIVLAILMIIMITILYIILMNQNKNGNTNNNQPTIKEEELVNTYEIEKELQPVKNRIDFYSVRECVNKYYSYYAVMFNAKEYYGTEDESILKEAEEQNSSVLYNMIDNEYIQAKSVTINNLKSKLEEIENVNVNISNMYVSQKTNNISVYLVKGNLQGKNIKQFEIIVKLDVLNRTFSIIPQEYVKEKYNDLIIGEEIEIGVPENIEKNDNNIYSYNVITDETYVKDLLNQLKSEMRYSSKLVYERLNEEYKSKKFETLENFKKHLDSNKEEYLTMQVVKYQKTVTDDYTQYVCIDNYGNYYIFRENAIMDYTLILDTYTIDLPEFIEKYNNASESEKVLLNIQRIFDAINDEDYKYVYNKLDKTFKNNNFKTEADFEQYIKETLFSKNKLNYSEYQKSGDLHIYKLIIANDNDTNTQTINKTFVMKLLKGTDFVFSFNKE